VLVSRVVDRVDRNWEGQGTRTTEISEGSLLERKLERSFRLASGNGHGESYERTDAILEEQSVALGDREETRWRSRETERKAAAALEEGVVAFCLICH
jgi:hypothetical protein